PNGWMGSSKSDLRAGEYDFLAMFQKRRGAAAEVGLLIVQVQFHVPVQMPVDSEGPRRCFGGGRGGIREAAIEEDIVIDVQLSETRGQLPGAPSALSGVERFSGNKSFERVILARENIRCGDLPGRVLE